MMVIVFCNLALLCRPDGVLRCWSSPGWVRVLSVFYWTVVPLVAIPTALWKRVKEEEDMLRVEFGGEWERWHARTARFVPWLF